MAMITVVFSIDLRHVKIGSRCSQEQGTAFQAIRASIENTKLRGSTLQGESEIAIVLCLPEDERIFGELVYWCGYAKFPYKTLWLNDVSEWHDGNLKP